MRNGKWRKLLLFDIDGTLLKSGHSRHGLAFEHAVKRCTGRDIPLKAVDTLGQIDNNIIHQMLCLAGLTPDEAEAALEEIRRMMVEDYLESEIDMRPHVLPGVHPTLSTLQMRGDFLMGLLTGNLEPIAWHKLAKAELRHYFRIGGFGNEGRERRELVGVVREKCRKNFERDFREKEIIIIGDTPRDIECGQINGALTIGVATGSFSKDQLREAGADLVLEDFSELQDREETALSLEDLLNQAG
ncbi:MAG: HAD family hydrolase [bacterium]